MATNRQTRGFSKAEFSRNIFEPDTVLVFSDVYGSEEIEWVSKEKQEMVYKVALNLLTSNIKGGDKHETLDKATCNTLLARLKPHDIPRTYENAFHHMFRWLEAANHITDLIAMIQESNMKTLALRYGPRKDQTEILDTRGVPVASADQRPPLSTPDSVPQSSALDQGTSPDSHQISGNAGTQQNDLLSPQQITQDIEQEISKLSVAAPQVTEEELKVRLLVGEVVRRFFTLAPTDRIMVIILMLGHRPETEDPVPITPQIAMAKAVLEDAIIEHVQDSGGQTCADRDLSAVVYINFGKLSRKNQMRAVISIISTWVEKKDLDRAIKALLSTFLTDLFKGTKGLTKGEMDRFGFD